MGLSLLHGRRDGHAAASRGAAPPRPLAYDVSIKTVIEIEGDFVRAFLVPFPFSPSIGGDPRFRCFG